MVKIRLKRVGRKNRPAFRLCAIDVRKPRDGTELEILGHYDPLVKDDVKKLTMNEDRVRYWLSVGAYPTETVASFLKSRGIEIPWEAKRKAAQGAPKAPGEAKEKPVKAAPQPLAADIEGAVKEKMGQLSRAEKKRQKGK